MAVQVTPTSHTTMVAMVALMSALLVSPPRPLSISRACSPSLSAVETENVVDVVQSLFGSESSSQAFARQGASISAVEAVFASRAKELTYGEFDLRGFLALLDEADPQPGDSFVDVGSGCGRLVLAAALAHPSWASATGVELLEHLHESAVADHDRLVALLKTEPSIGLAPCRFVCGEATEHVPKLLATSDSTGSAAVVFVYATCWPGAGPYLPALSHTLASSIPVGSRVITVDKQLVEEDEEGGAWSFSLLSQRQMSNYNTYESTAYVYRLDTARGSSGEDEGVRRGRRRHGQVVACAAADDDDGLAGDEQQGVERLSLSAQMQALTEAAEAQAEAAEAIGEGWDEIADMERQLADTLGVPYDDLEAFLDGDDDEILGGADEIEGAVERLKGDDAGPECLPYDVL